MTKAELASLQGRRPAATLSRSSSSSKTSTEVSEDLRSCQAKIRSSSLASSSSKLRAKLGLSLETVTSFAQLDHAFAVECNKFLDSFPDLEKSYLPLLKIGEGTFSTVFKALDLNESLYESSDCLLNDLQYEGGDSHGDRAVQELLNYRCITEQHDGLKYLSDISASDISRWSKALNSYIERVTANRAELPSSDNDDIEQLHPFKRNPIVPTYVALKRINMSSLPDRVFDEIRFIWALRGCPEVVSIIKTIRYEDQVVVVTPYFKHQDFREYLSSLTVEDIKYYLFRLFKAIRHVHSRNIIHRDLKPSNFLYSVSEKKGLLVDFGLAQEYVPKSPAHTIKSQSHQRVPSIPLSPIKPNVAGLTSPSPSLSSSFSSLCSKSSTFPRNVSVVAVNSSKRMKTMKTCYVVNDTRPPIKASRAGTRGFRAPEVLFKYADQTPAIDIWSIGTIFLTILTRKYPFFNSPDDIEAAAELAIIFGDKAMAEAGKLYGRIWNCSGYMAPHTTSSSHHNSQAANWGGTSGEGIPLRTLVARFNPELYETLPEEAFSLLNQCLALNFRHRITSEEALLHPFFDSIRDKCL